MVDNLSYDPSPVKCSWLHQPFFNLAASKSRKIIINNFLVAQSKQNETLDLCEFSCQADQYQDDVCFVTIKTFCGYHYCLS